MRDSPPLHRPHARTASPSRQDSIALTPGKHRPHARKASPSRQGSIARTPGLHRPHAKAEREDCQDSTGPISRMTLGANVQSSGRSVGPASDLDYVAAAADISISSGLSEHAATELPRTLALALSISMLARLLRKIVLQSGLQRKFGQLWPQHALALERALVDARFTSTASHSRLDCIALTPALNASFVRTDRAA